MSFPGWWKEEWWRHLPALTCLVLLLSACRATGQSGSDAEYLREKREAVRRLSPYSYPQMKPTYDSLLKNLDRRLRAVIGPVNVPGFGPVAELNLEGHYDGDPIFGMLDGVVFRSDDYTTRLFVTTPAIMSAWLADNAPGSSIDSALNSPSLLTGAIIGEATIMRYADLPVADARRKGIVSAMLELTAQDIGPWPPDELLISVVRRDRIFIIRTRPVVAIDTISVCNERMAAAFKDARSPNTIEFGDSVHEKYRACYADHLSRIPGIEKIISQVDSLVKLLPPR